MNSLPKVKKKINFYKKVTENNNQKKVEKDKMAEDSGFHVLKARGTCVGVMNIE